MAETPSILGPTRKANRGGTEPRTFSLMEVAQETGIAMPILLRYKREYPDQIPSEGSGSQQRFPEEAFEIFAELHRKEAEQRDLPRRGGFGLLSLPRVRRRREAPAPEREAEPQDVSEAESVSETARSEEPEPAPAAAAEDRTATPVAVETQPAATETQAAAVESQPATAPTGPATLTLKAISDELGVAYPTIARYATKHEDRIPHVGHGRKRRFPPEAIAVFQQIRKESKPGRPPKAKTEKKRAAAGSPRPAPISQSVQSAAPARAAAEPAAAAFSGRASDALAQRIDRLERQQQQLETLVRSLREELERPLTAIVEPA